MTPNSLLSSLHMFTAAWGRTSNRPIPQGYRAHVERLLTNEQWARGCETLAFHLAKKPEGARILLMTTPQQGTDTTTALIGLGLCLARMGRSVVLVEANFRRATFESIFGAGERTDRALAPGLADFIEGRAGQSDIERVVDIEMSGTNVALKFVTSGRISAQGVAPLTSPRLTRLFQSWKEDGSFVLIDSPPVLEVNDALLLAPSVDGVVLALSAGSIHEKDARKAKAWLDASGSRVVGSVLWV